MLSGAEMKFRFDYSERTTPERRWQPTGRSSITPDTLTFMALAPDGGVAH